MAPPGFAPPSYSSEQFGERPLHKEPPPAGTDTNGRAYLIFFSYLGVCLMLTNIVVLNIAKSYRRLRKTTNARLPSRNHVRVFTVLAAGSLLTTRYYQYRAFAVSYQSWVMWRSHWELTPDQMHWGLWLKETSLLKETWMATIVGNANYWWTHQIFFFACSLSLSLEQLGIQRGIKHTWAYMLLGQVVGISFAINLFFIELLLSPPPPPPPSSTSIHRKKWLGPWLVQLLTIAFVQYPTYMLADEYYWFHQTEFLPMLLTPHIALLVLPFARAALPEKYFTDSNIEFAGTVYRYLWGTTILGGSLLLLKMTIMTYDYSGLLGFWNALLEHPAVSSVAFDVIFCWISWFTWWRVLPQTIENELDFQEDDRNHDLLVGASSGSATDHMGTMRRR